MHSLWIPGAAAALFCLLAIGSAPALGATNESDEASILAIARSQIFERGPALCHCLGASWVEGGSFISDCPCRGMRYVGTLIAWNGLNHAGCMRCAPYDACSYSLWRALSCDEKGLGQEASDPPTCAVGEILVDTGYGCVKCLSMSCLGLQSHTLLQTTNASWGRVKAKYH